MKLSREQIVNKLKELTSEAQVVTDVEVLKESSIDRFRKVESYFGVYTQPLPAAIVFVESKEDVKRVIDFANENGVNIVPRTGGSGTEGGLETVIENSIVLDGSRMNRILDINTTDMVAVCQCGVPLQVLEDELRAMGYTTGHSPQSKPLAQMGGLVATRSIGQFSTLYGGIEDMVAGVEAVFPNIGIAKIKSVPRRAAGPDIRHVVIGNEGALCFITEVTVKIFKYYPENNQFISYLLNDMKTGVDILREIMVEGYRPSVARLYDEPDAERHFGDDCKGKCMIIFMAEGPKGIVEATASAIEEIIQKKGGVEKVDSKIVEKWFSHLTWGMEVLEAERALTIKTRNTVSTTEVSAPWSAIMQIYERCKERIPKEVPDITYLAAHSSHSYINGTNLYFVYRHDMNCEPEEDLEKYHMPIKKIIVEETLNAGGSMCHHHGVGKHRAHWINEEHGSAYPILLNLKQSFDPNGIMNKGTIIPVSK